LSSGELKRLKYGLNVQKESVNFYRASTEKLKHISWVDNVAVTHVSKHVDTEVKGSRECHYRCEFQLGVSKCCLQLEGTFSRSSRSTDLKRSRKGRDLYFMSLSLDGQVAKPFHSRGKIDQNCIYNLVSSNRSLSRAARHQLQPHLKLDKFKTEFASVLFELMKGTTVTDTDFHDFVMGRTY